MLFAAGIGRYLSSLLPRLIAADPTVGYDLLCDPAEVHARGADWTRLPRIGLRELRAPIYSLREQILFPRVVAAGTDLFWAPHYNFPIAYRGRLLVTVHDVFHLANPDLVGGVHRRVYARAMFELLSRRANRIVCVSRFTADELARRVGVDSRKVRVIHNGVDRSWFVDGAGASPSDRPYLLAVGNVKPHKNLRRLIHAFARIADDVQHDLILVGKQEGFLTSDQEVQRMALGLGKRVRFTGVIDDVELRRYLQNADVLVFPSLYEGFGLPPLEAMACGCPVVVSRIGALEEVCGDAALYCDPVDETDIARQIRRLLEDRILRAEMIERGKVQAERFSWDRSATETREALQEAARG
jgi:glycosyltransferase involved in cell wall biosynthesis